LADLATDEADIGVAVFSSLNKTGVGDAAELIQGWALSPEEAQAIAVQAAAEAEARAAAEAAAAADEADQA